MSLQRLFIAIPLKDEIRQGIIKTMQCLNRRGGIDSIHWEPSEKLHITVKFLGAVPTEKIPNYLSSTSKCISALPAFSISFTSFILLPRQHPKTITLGVNLSSELNHLFKQIDTTLIEEGIPQETRPFLPHITIGRAKHHSHLTPECFIETCNQILGETQLVEHIILFKTETKPNTPGSYYVPLHHWYF